MLTVFKSFILREKIILNLSFWDHSDVSEQQHLKKKVQESQFTILMSVYDNIYDINIMDYDLSWLV